MIVHYLRLSPKRVVAMAVVVIAAVGVAVWQGVSGRWLDDYAYMTVPMTDAEIAAAGMDASSIEVFTDCCGPDITSFGQLPEAMWRHYLIANGRLANMLAFVMMQLPVWVLAVLQGVAYLLMIIGMLRLSGVGRGWIDRPLRCVLLVAVSWIVLPWSDGFASGTFMINYVWSAVASLWLLILLMRPGRSVGARGALYALAFVAAMMHEGLTVAVLAALPVVLWGAKRRCRRTTLIAVGVYVAGAALMLVAPGLRNRIGMQGGPSWNFLMRDIVVGMLPIWVACLSMFSVTLRGRWRRERRVMLRRWTLMAAMLAGTAVCLVVKQGERAAFFPYILSVTLIFDIWGAWLSSLCRAPRLALSCSVLGAVLLSLWLWRLAWWQHRASEERDRVMAQVEATGRPVAWVDTYDFTQLPWWLMDIPGYIGSSDEGDVELMAAHVFKTLYPNIAVLPERWKGVDPDSLPAVAGSAGLRGEYPQYCSRRRLRDMGAVFTYGAAEVPFYRLNAAPHYALKGVWSGGGASHVTLQEVCVPQAVGDTLWCYRVRHCARSMRCLPVIRIDTIP